MKFVTVCILDWLKVPAVFHNLRGYDSQLIMQEIGMFDVKIDIIPNGLEKHMPFRINRNIVFFDSTQFMTSGLDVFFKKLSDNIFKYFFE